MRSKKLDAIPTSGEYEEIIFELEGPWRGNGWNFVLFTTTDHQEWVGAFRDKDIANFKIAELDNGIACVVSGGHGYVVDIDKKQKIKDLEIEMIIDVKSDSATESFLISTWWDINLIDKDLNEVTIDLPVQADGIYFGEMKGRNLNLEIELIGADMAKTNDYYLDLDERKVKKRA